MRERYRPAYMPRNEKPAPHPVFIPRLAKCLECGETFRQTAAIQNACPGPCREQRAKRIQRLHELRRLRRQGRQE